MSRTGAGPYVEAASYYTRLDVASAVVGDLAEVDVDDLLRQIREASPFAPVAAMLRQAASEALRSFGALVMEAQIFATDPHPEIQRIQEEMEAISASLERPPLPRRTRPLASPTPAPSRLQSARGFPEARRQRWIGRRR